MSGYSFKFLPGDSDSIPEGEEGINYWLLETNIIKLLKLIILDSLLDTNTLLAANYTFLEFVGTSWQGENIGLPKFTDTPAVFDSGPNNLVFSETLDSWTNGTPSLETLDYNDLPDPSTRVNRLIFAIDSSVNEKYLGFSVGSEWLLKKFP